MGCQKIKTIGWIVFEIIDGLAGSENSLDLNMYMLLIGLLYIEVFVITLQW